MPTPYSLLLAISLLGATTPLAAQTTPTARSGTVRLATSLEARTAQCFTDLTQQLRAAYFAPSDGRAISLLSATITEFTARKKGLLAEIAQQKSGPATTALRHPDAAQTRELETLLTGSAATKLAARRQRNPALDYAFRHFDQAQLTTLLPFQAAAE